MAHPKQNIVQNTPYYPVSRVALTVGSVGALVGGTSSAARNLRRVKNNEISSETAVKEVFKEAAGVGVAIGAATAVVKIIAPRSSILGIVGIAALATSSKILWDSATGKKATCLGQPTPAEEQGNDPKNTPVDKENTSGNESETDKKTSESTEKEKKSKK